MFEGGRAQDDPADSELTHPTIFSGGRAEDDPADGEDTHAGRGGVSVDPKSEDSDEGVRKSRIN